MEGFGEGLSRVLRQFGGSKIVVLLDSKKGGTVKGSTAGRVKRLGENSRRGRTVKGRTIKGGTVGRVEQSRIEQLSGEQ